MKPEFTIDKGATDEQRLAINALLDITEHHPKIVMRTAEFMMTRTIDDTDGVFILFNREAREAHGIIRDFLLNRADRVLGVDDNAEAAIRRDPRFDSLMRQESTMSKSSSPEQRQAIKDSQEEIRDKRRLVRLAVLAGRVAATQEREDSEAVRDDNSHVA
jgi:hypothetical protein